MAHPTFPDSLREPYATAVREAVAAIREDYQPTSILLSGTILRGTPHPNSDLDLVVLHHHHWRQRRQRWFHGVPAEIFVNPAFQLSRTFPQEAATGRPVMAHMIATGWIIGDDNGELARLRTEAETSLGAGPVISRERLTQLAYAIVTGLEDAVDIAGFDPDRARTLLSEALIEAARLRFLQANRWLPRSKTLLSELDLLDPAIGSIVRRALNTADIGDAMAIAALAIEEIAGATRFFEWESEPQQLEP